MNWNQFQLCLQCFKGKHVCLNETKYAHIGAHKEAMDEKTIPGYCRDAKTRRGWK